MPTPYDREKNNRFIQTDQMSDEAIWDLLSVYADGEATPEEVAQVETLLQRLPSLTNELKFLRYTAGAARTIVEVEPPAHLRSAIFAATIHRPTLARRVGMALERWQAVFAPRTARFALAGGAFAAAGLAMLLLLPHQPQQGGTVQVKLGQESTVVVNHPATVPGDHGLSGTTEQARPLHHSTENIVVAKPPIHTPTQANPQHDVTPKDKMAMLALNVDRMVVTHLLSAVPAPIHTKLPSAASKQAVAVVKVQRPVNLEHVVSNEPGSQFSPLPKMDNGSQHALTLAMVKNSDDSLGTNIDSSHDTAPEQPAATVTPTPNSGGNRIIRVSLSQLPPEARHYQTTADIKRELDARNLGMSRLQLNAVERKQCSVALINSRF